jgi:hypothetical protein
MDEQIKAKDVGPVAPGYMTVPIFNPLLTKMLKRAGDDFKFPGNTKRDENGKKI